MVYFYLAVFIVSFILSGIYVFAWDKHYDVNITVIFTIIPIACLGYLGLSLSHNLDTSLFSQKIVYLGGSFLTFFITMCVLNLCEINVSRFFRLFLFTLNSIIYALILTIGYSKIYYKNVSYVEGAGLGNMVKEYGPFHYVFYVNLIIYLVFGLIVIIYSLLRKNQISNKILVLLTLPEILCFIGFFFNFVLGRKVDIMPVMYVLAQVVYLIIIRRMSLYNVIEMVIETIAQTGETGFITIDKKLNYLGSNQTARKIFPVLEHISVDKNIKTEESFKGNIIHWIEVFDKNPSLKRNLYLLKDMKNEDNDKMYAVEINYLYDGVRKCGYQLFITDDTQNQKYIRLLDDYNNELEKQVDEKTKHIVEMHDNLILSMAMMVESRDNSTGGHIRRTSENVRILIDEIKKSGDLQLNEEFCKDIIKAAPMHDIGKIAVDDEVLRKPGRFTPEEYEKMKEHSAQGARIVHEILKDTDDESFKEVAENVAHYHHERWDGSGYPEGLRGEEIPLEARIMAIADVYDALVSKRVYKDSMSFEDADKIIMDGMGTQFDEGLKKYYEKSRPRLEKYYSSQEV